MLADNDPMKGYYDRVAQVDDEKQQMLRNLLLFLCGSLEQDKQRYRQHCVELGYGTEETMKILLPEERVK